MNEKEVLLEQLGVGGHIPESAVGKQHLGDSVKGELLRLLTIEVIKLHWVSPLWGRSGHGAGAFPGRYIPFADRDSVHSSSFGISMWADRTRIPYSFGERPAWRSGNRESVSLTVQGLENLCSHSYHRMPSSRMIFFVHQPIQGRSRP